MKPLPELAAIQINERAPIILGGEVEIGANVDVVWDMLAGIASWPSWNPEVRSATVEGDLVPGTVFRWRAGPSHLTSRLICVDPPRQIAWTGTTMGLRVVHAYSLEPRGEKTFVRTEESVEGITARILRGPIKRRMDSAIATGLAGLKTAAERGTANSRFPC